MEFIANYKAKRTTPAQRAANVYTLTVEEFERTNVQKVGYKVNEFLANNKMVRPYYDYDLPLSSSSGEIDEDLFNEHYDIFKGLVEKLHPGAEIAYAHRCGLKTKINKTGNTKTYDTISFRAYVKGYKMHLGEIKHLINKTFPNIEHKLDTSVYGEKEQCLAVINGHKEDCDKRFLIPMSHNDEKRAFLAQYMYGDEEVISVIAPAEDMKKGKSIRSTALVKRSEGAIVEETEDEELEDEINRVNKTPLSWIKCERVLTSIGFLNPTRKRTKEDGFDFDADRSVPCAACGNRIHDSYDFYILQLFGSFFVVKSYSDKCTARYINWEDNLMKNIITHPLTHCYYAEFFSAIYKNRLVWTVAKRFMFFNGTKWSEVTIEEVSTILMGTLTNLLQYVAKYLHDRQYKLDMETKSLKNELSDKDIQDRKVLSKLYADQYRKVISGIDYITKDGNLRCVLNISKNLMISPAFEETLDRNGWLLGFDNGILDLQTCQFRQAKAMDRISMSTGYNFISKDDENWDQSVMNDVTSFLERIFPVEEERELVQRYGGYCLLGVHPCKIFVVHTDTRKGNNGKSKYTLMQMSALGDHYSKDAGSGAILYKNDKQENVNSHQDGMLEYDKKRLVVIEELSESKSLANDLVKKLNGGAAKFSGRKAYGKGDHSFPWITKMVMCCNNRKFPSFDWSDGALLDRLVIIHHRSRFCTNDEQYERDKHIPYTYRAEDKDTEICGSWRPYIMHWFIEGLKTWHQKSFREIPDVCREWKKGLVAVQDTVTPWIEDHLRKNESKDENNEVVHYVCKAELYNRFKDAVPEERNRKTRVGPAVFEEKLIEYLGPCLDRTRVKINGEKKQVRNVWLNWRFDIDGEHVEGDLDV